MKKKPEKQKDLEALRAELKKSSNVFLTGYEKLTVGQDFELRKTVRGAGANYKVIKNRIAEKAAEGTPAADLLKDLKGMCSLAYTSGDPVALAKALTAYAKVNPSFTFRAGMVQGSGDAAFEGRNLRKAFVVDPGAGSAAGVGDERGGSKSSRGGGPGR
jgi:large subunit ribosomal protein L10